MRTLPTALMLTSLVTAWSVSGIALSAVAADSKAPAAVNAPANPSATMAAAFEAKVKPLLATYCSACHGAEKHKGDVDFSTVRNGEQAIGQTVLWRSTLAKLTDQEMPPAKAKEQPSSEERQALMAWMQGLKRLQAPDPGPLVIRRLARVEYDNTIRDLFGVDLKAGSDLPADAPGEGFDNSISPLLMEKYLLAADDILDRIITPDQYHLLTPAGQLGAIIAGVPEEGKPDGKTRVFTSPAEFTTVLSLPAEGTYTIRFKAGAETFDRDPVRVGVRFDGQFVQEQYITATTKHPATYSFTTKLVAGKTRLSLVFINPVGSVASAAAPAPAGAPPPAGAAARKTPAAPAKSDPPPSQSRTLLIESLEITGPPAHMAGDAQRRVFVVSPGKDLSKRDAAQKIAEAFAYRAYRRPPTTVEIQALVKIFGFGNDQDEVFNESIKLMLKAVLVSPQFLYRTPDDRANATVNTAVVPVGDFELASRLSYFLWATMPDDELLKLAQGGTLHDPAVLTAQVKRLMKDPRSHALAENFALPWLGLDRLAELTLDEKKFPGVGKELRQAMSDEGTVFFESLMHDSGSVLDFIDSDYAWMNGLTAKLYGNDMVKGPKMQKVHLDDNNRGGAVTMPGVLMATSTPNRTSPVKRGKWVLEQLLGASPPPPPPNVPALDKQDVPENAKLTLRQRTERHRDDPACVSCHRVMDPIGFGLENFDAIGRWRNMDDTGGTVDSIGELPGKQRFTSPAELKRILMVRKDEFLRTFTGKLLAFALGRKISGYDEVVVDDLVAQMAKDEYKLDALIIRIATSYPFLNRQILHATPQ
jgi:mono/diheme cytochrome c family protein